MFIYVCVYIYTCIYICVCVCVCVCVYLIDDTHVCLCVCASEGCANFLCVYRWLNTCSLFSQRSDV